MRIFLAVSFLALTLFSCKNKKRTETPDPTKPVLPPVTVVEMNPVRDSLLLELTKEVMTAFSKKDYAALSLLVHPDEGVRFSPYAFIDTTVDKVVTAGWIKQQADKSKQEKIVWGTVDPTDEPIHMTLDGYLQQYVYDVEFIQPENEKVNVFIGSGNTMNNLLEVYKGCDFTESHFSGFEKKYEGMDWKSLRLVYKWKDNKYYLVGVVHDQWTT